MGKQPLAEPCKENSYHLLQHMRLYVDSKENNILLFDLHTCDVVRKYRVQGDDDLFGNMYVVISTLNTKKKTAC